MTGNRKAISLGWPAWMHRSRSARKLRMNAAAPIPTVMVTPANHMDPLTAVTVAGSEFFSFLWHFVAIIAP